VPTPLQEPHNPSCQYKGGFTWDILDSVCLQRTVAICPQCNGACIVLLVLQAVVARVPLPPAPDLQGADPRRSFNAVVLAFLGDGVWEVSYNSNNMN
jgi:hypothetical protein